MTLASIDWLRAGADILGAFGCAYVGQWWGYRQGVKAGRRQVAPIGIAAHDAKPGEAVRIISVPDRDDERLPT